MSWVKQNQFGNIGRNFKPKFNAFGELDRFCNVINELTHICWPIVAFDFRASNFA